MSYWLKLFVFTIVIGFAKANHFIRVVILAGLGLAGLWMVHTLAQDFNMIQGSRDTEENSGNIFKRSISDGRKSLINWETVLSKDPASCARSFLCQLAATNAELLSKDERLMLDIVRNSQSDHNWATKQLQDAMQTGEAVGKPSHCMKIYKYCPYTSQMMMVLLRMFGR